MNNFKEHYKKILSNNNSSWNKKSLELDIFSKNQVIKTLGDYSYIEPTCDVYYIKNLDLFVDEDKKLFLFSNWKFQNEYYFLEHIDTIIESLKNYDLKKAIELEDSYLWCQRWFCSYGHFCDDCFNNFNFKYQSNKKFDNYSVLIEFHNNQEENNGYRIPKNNHNYRNICNYLFNDKYYNPNDSKACDLYKLKKIVLISNSYHDPTFHKFPKSARNFIISKISNTTETHPNLFLTRSEGLHMKRLLDNMADIEKYMKEKNFNILNPENTNYLELVRNIKNAKKLILTWGGALVLLMYASKDAQITIIQGKYYGDENLGVIKNLLANYELKNISVIKVPTNILDLKLLNC